MLPNFVQTLGTGMLLYLWKKQARDGLVHRNTKQHDPYCCPLFLELSIIKSLEKTDSQNYTRYFR